MLLGHTLRNPDDVSAFLLFQLEVGVEDPEVELLHKRVHVQLNLLLEELVFQRFVLVALSLALEDVLIVGVVVGDRSHLIVVVRLRQRGQTVRIQIATFRIQFRSGLAVQLGAERVDRDHERSTVGLERYSERRKEISKSLS